MQKTVEEVIGALIDREGRYVNDPNDLGGETNWGITKAVARANGYDGDMREMPRFWAHDYYRRVLWADTGFSRVHSLSTAVAAELLDTAVNMGSVYPRMWLQRWLNAFNDQAALYRDLRVDGLIGPATLAALQAFLDHRGSVGEAVLLAGLNASQAVRYLEITEARARNERFIYGWMVNRVATPA